MARQFFRSSIQELEALFKENNNNVDILLALEEELSHRKIKRAVKLRTQVGERLAILQPKAPWPKPVPEKSSSGRSPDDQSGSRPHEKHLSSQSPPTFPESPSKGGPSGIDRKLPPPPPMTNRPGDVLSAWTATEVLSPQVYVRSEDLAAGDKRRVVALSETLPWEQGERSRPSQRLYYQIVLGSIKLESAIGCLVDRYGDNREEPPLVRGKAALAIVAVDRHGQLVELPAVGISSFGWGVMSALNGDLADLAGWTDVEPRLVERIEKQLLGAMTGDEVGEERRTHPLTRAALFAAYEGLINELGLPRDWVEPPGFAIRSYVYFKDPNPPEPLLLNCFFLADLALAHKLFAEGKAPQNLRR